jgi:hypothetical protein
MYRLKFKSQYGNMKIYIDKGIAMMESGVQHALADVHSQADRSVSRV